MNARLTLSENTDHSEALALSGGDPLDFTGKFFVRVIMRDMPLDAVVTSAVLELDGREVAHVENPEITDYLSYGQPKPEQVDEAEDEQAPEVAPLVEEPQEGPSGFFVFDRAISSDGDHQVRVTIVFSDKTRFGVGGLIGAPEPEPERVPPQIEVLRRLGATPVTEDIAQRLLDGGSAELDEVKEALADIGTISEQDLDLADIQTLASLATGMRDGLRRVVVARELLRKAVSGDA